MVGQTLTPTDGATRVRGMGGGRFDPVKDHYATERELISVRPARLSLSTGASEMVVIAFSLYPNDRSFPTVMQPDRA